MKTKLIPLAAFLATASAALVFAAAARGPASSQRPVSSGGPMAACPAGTCVGGAGDCAAGECAKDGCITAPGAGAPAAADATPLILSPAAQAALRFQIDEERMARELYQSFGQKWDFQPFRMIPRSEAQHEAVLRQLATRAGMPAPSATAGRFDSEEVQLRFEALLALGLESPDSALRAGAFVEEQDIVDLDTLLAATDSPALKATVTALRTASTHHLRAFVGTLQARGVTYEPKLLKADEFKAIVATAPGARAGHGPGRGAGPGRR